MGKFKKPSRQLGKFVKENKSGLDKKSLVRVIIGTASSTLLINLISSSVALSQHSSHSAGAQDFTTLIMEHIGGTTCHKVVPSHVSVDPTHSSAHSSHSSHPHSSHSNHAHGSHSNHSHSSS